MNNKQSSVELFIEQLEEKGKAYEETVGVRTVNICIDVSEYMELKTKAKAMHKEESESKYQEGREIGKIEVLTSQSTKNASEYSQGYNKGFLAALEYMNSTIENKIKLRQYEK